MQQHHDLVDFVDTDSVQFVNPYEINPIIDANLSPQMLADNSLQELTLQDTISPQFGEVYLPESPEVKIKMEEFSDLSHLLPVAPSKHLLIGSTDELITPVFDRDAFDFVSYLPVKQNKTENIVKVESNKQFTSCGKIIFNDLYNGIDKLTPPSEQLDNNNLNDQKHCSYPYGTYGKQPTLNISDKSKIHAGSPIYQELFLPSTTASGKQASYNSAISVSNSNIYTYVTSPQEDRYSYSSSSPKHQTRLGLVTPEDSNSSEDTKQRMTLKINGSLVKLENESYTLNTPDVIEEVVNLGNDFNILDLVNNEDLRVLNVEEDVLSTLSPPVPPSTPSTPSSVVSKPPAPSKRRRRKVSYEDDEEDEDYIPPTKKRSTVRLSDIDIEDTSDSETEAKKYKHKTPKARGRPPKPQNPVSSEVSKDSDGSRYRELRDKNNEASRKSRLKRKVKELEYEKEADELHSKNIRLKAQVEELEKMVSTFRNNLFQILVKK